MRERQNNLARAVTRIQAGDDPEAVLAALHTSCDGHGAVVPEAYLVPLPRSARLRRSPAGLLLDLCARTCADARAIGERLTVFAAHRIEESRAYRRLGYRTAADYAREQLAITPREFRDLARLGRRLARLPRIRKAYLDGELTRTQADVIAGASMPSHDGPDEESPNEERWLGLARSGTVRELKRAAREAREAAEAREARAAREVREAAEGREAQGPVPGRGEAEDGREAEEAGGPTEEGQLRRVGDASGAGEARGAGEASEASRASEAGEATQDLRTGRRLPSSTRQHVAFDVPPELLGKIDAVLDLASRVAGARLPAGTLWEFIAAEYLSGVPREHGAGVPRERGEGVADRGGGGVACARRGGNEGLSPPTTELSPAHTGRPADVEEAASDRSGRRRVTCPEDPMGRQRYFEESSRNWSFLPGGRMEVRPEGFWKRLAAMTAQLAVLAEPTAATAPGQGFGPGVAGRPGATSGANATRRTETTVQGGNGRAADAIADAPSGDQDRAIGPSPWELHRQMTAALEQARTVNWQLGRILGLIRNRRLWRDMLFSSFGHYVRERLGISVRHAQRLVRADRMAMMSPAFAEAWKAGELSALQADLLVRVLTWVGSDDVKRAWIEVARRSTFDRFSELVRRAERLRREDDPEWCRARSHPSVAEARLRDGEENAARLRRGESLEGGSSSASCTDSDAGAGPHEGDPANGRPDGDATVFVTSYRVWMTAGERETLERAVEVARESLFRGRPPPERAGTGAQSAETVPTYACLELLLDSFIAEYGGDRARTLTEQYPIFERDGWRCRVPGCRAVAGLHAHHIVFLARGGGDEPENLVVLCDWHHKVLHEGWIRCVGKAPDRLSWELGVGGGAGAARSTHGRGHSGGGNGGVLPEAPVARFLGHRRLADDEYWDGVGIRKIQEGAPAA